MTSPPAVRAAAFFDLDKTIIATSSTLAFSRPFYRGGLITRSAVLRSGYAQFVYLLGGADADQMERMRAYLSSMCAGWPVAQVQQIVAETLHDLIDPRIYDEAATLIEEHHAAGRDVVIVSSSGAEVVGPIGAMLGADTVVATEMVVEAGHYTGEIAFYCYGENKAEAVRRLADERGYDLARCFAYSDSVTDLPMLSEVGHPFTVNPDRALRREAANRSWPVLIFAKPVRMRDRIPSLRIPQSSTFAVAAAAAGVTAALTVWFAARRNQDLD